MIIFDHGKNDKINQQDYQKEILYFSPKDNNRSNPCQVKNTCVGNVKPTTGIPPDICENDDGSDKPNVQPNFILNFFVEL